MAFPGDRGPWPDPCPGIQWSHAVPPDAIGLSGPSVPGGVGGRSSRRWRFWGSIRVLARASRWRPVEGAARCADGSRIGPHLSNRMRYCGYQRATGAPARNCSRAEVTAGATATISSWAAKTSSASSEIIDPTSRADMGLAPDAGMLVGRATTGGRIAFCLLSFAGWNRRAGLG